MQSNNLNNSVHEGSYLNNPYLEIRNTKYGGRGYFSTKFIPKDTNILVCDNPFLSIIFQTFKKEVCANCFSYDLGRPRKVKLTRASELKRNHQNRTYAGLFFCSEECRDNWSKIEDFDQLMSSALDAIDEARSKCRKSNRTSDRGLLLYSDECTLNNIWKAVVQPLSAHKARKQNELEKLEILNDEEYDLARFIAIAIVKNFRAHGPLSTEESRQRYSSEWKDFNLLQSNEAAHLTQYPSLLHSHLTVYKFLISVLDTRLLPYLSTDLVRDTLGRDAGNAFGIWQLPLTMESECLGSSIYPLASFFNHSCDPNVKKERLGRSMVFRTTTDVQPNQELHISYGMIQQFPLRERMAQLKNQWDFECKCAKCSEELTE